MRREKYVEIHLRKLLKLNNHSLHPKPLLASLPSIDSSVHGLRFRSAIVSLHTLPPSLRGLVLLVDLEIGFFAFLTWSRRVSGFKGQRMLLLQEGAASESSLFPWSPSSALHLRYLFTYINHSKGNICLLRKFYHKLLKMSVWWERFNVCLGFCRLSAGPKVWGDFFLELLWG